MECKVLCLLCPFARNREPATLPAGHPSMSANGTHPDIHGYPNACSPDDYRPQPPVANAFSKPDSNCCWWMNGLTTNLFFMVHHHFIKFVPDVSVGLSLHPHGGVSHQAAEAPWKKQSYSFAAKKVMECKELCFLCPFARNRDCKGLGLQHRQPIWVCWLSSVGPAGPTNQRQ